MKNKVLMQILKGASDKNISFSETCNLLKRLGFKERIKGDHHIFSRDGVVEIINLQPKGSMTKAYQIKQIRTLLIKYKMTGDKNEQI